MATFATRCAEFATPLSFQTDECRTPSGFRLPKMQHTLRLPKLPLALNFLIRVNKNEISTTYIESLRFHQAHPFELTIRRRVLPRPHISERYVCQSFAI